MHAWLRMEVGGMRLGRGNVRSVVYVGENEEWVEVFQCWGAPPPGPGSRK